MKNQIEVKISKYKGFEIIKYKPNKSKRHTVWKIYKDGLFINNYSRLIDAMAGIDFNLKNGNFKNG